MRGKVCLMLLISAVCAMCSGCGDGTYVVEKKYWHAVRAEHELMKQYPKDIPPDKLQEMIFRYKEIALQAPFWKGSVHVSFKLAHFYELSKNFAAAEKEYGRICRDFPDDVEYCANALRMTALNYEAQNQWDKAEKIYARIHADYPYTVVGMLVPLYVAQRQDLMGNREQAHKAAQEACLFYAATIRSAISDDVTIRAMELIAQCFSGLGIEQEGVEFFEGLAGKNPGTVLELRAFYKLAQFYQGKKDAAAKEKVEHYIALINQKFPNNSAAKKLIDSIREDKKQ